MSAYYPCCFAAVAHFIALLQGEVVVTEKKAKHSSRNAIQNILNSEQKQGEFFYCKSAPKYCLVIQSPQRLRGDSSTYVRSSSR